MDEVVTETNILELEQIQVQELIDHLTSSEIESVNLAKVLRDVKTAGLDSYEFPDGWQPHCAHCGDGFVYSTIMGVAEGKFWHADCKDELTMGPMQMSKWKEVMTRAR
ncbi:hypothetical protein [Halosegnis longus]|uniref:hypothetical protein n=1 Tax=Halosegnis longus TaxID=2216012 RepID=UPI00129D79A1|nr:hypothetical protein [Halosegnis longus]